jgi:hypothetical protein
MLKMNIMTRKAQRRNILQVSPSTTKQSFFDIPSCFMAKGPKVQFNESGSEDEEEPSKEKLIKLLQEDHSFLNKKREEYKELCKKHKYSFKEHLPTHEALI